MTYCIACKNMNCHNMGKSISMSYKCKDEKRMQNAYKIKSASTLEDIKELIVEVLTEVIGHEPVDVDSRVNEWLSK